MVEPVVTVDTEDEARVRRVIGCCYDVVEFLDGQVRGEAVDPGRVERLVRVLREAILDLDNLESS